MASVVIAIPLMRPHRLAAVVESIAESTDDYRIVVAAATGECADAARALPVDLLEDGGGTWAQRINGVFKVTNEPYFMTGADDLRFTPGWFPAVMREMDQFPDSCGVVAVNDLHNHSGVHFVFARSYVLNFHAVLDEDPGVFCCEKYRHTYVDDEIRATAQFHGRWRKSADAIVEHMHPGAGKAADDETYRIGEASMAQGRELFASRAHLWSQD